MRLAGQEQPNFPKIFKDIGALKVNSRFKAGIYKAHAREAANGTLAHRPRET